MRLTSHDVARLAGVSQPTVSRALRGDPRVAPDTRRKVLEAATTLGYVPNASGRSLSTRSSRQVAMVADLENPLYPRLVAPIHDTLLAHGHRVVVIAERADAADTPDRLVDGSVDGAILTTTLQRSTLPFHLHRRGLPFVLLNRTTDLVDADQVLADNEAGGCQAAELLLELGHRRVGAILGTPATSSARQREAGFRAGMLAAGVVIRDEDVVRGDFRYHDGYAGLRALMENRMQHRSDRPTAVFCVNDMVAVGALNAANELGLRVPDDLSVIGFDDLDVAAWPTFGLTTIRVDLAEMAARAAELVALRIASAESYPTAHETFATRVVLRATHGAPPA